MLSKRLKIFVKIKSMKPFYIVPMVWFHKNNRGFVQEEIRQLPPNIFKKTRKFHLPVVGKFS